jgi:hypothetical protein
MYAVKVSTPHRLVPLAALRTNEVPLLRARERRPGRAMPDPNSFGQEANRGEETALATSWPNHFCRVPKILLRPVGWESNTYQSLQYLAVVG